jgi:hypothetical protein
VESPLFDASQTHGLGHHLAANHSAGMSSAATVDRRRSARVRAPVPAWVSGDSHDRSARGRDVGVVDLSEHGVGFRDGRGDYRIGAAHWLVVNGTSRLSTRIRIVSCRRNRTGGYDVGAVFF